MVVIYYVEEDKNISRAVKEFLSRAGYQVWVFPTIEDIRQALRNMLPALVLVDWNMPDGNGNRLCQWIHQTCREVPVIFIAARGGLHGVMPDGYVVKPFELDALLLRIQNRMRKREQGTRQYLSCGTISLERNQMKVFCSGDEIRLNSSEYRILLYLMQNKGRAVTRKQLMELVWDKKGNTLSDNTLTVTMKRLREKLRQPACLKTVHRVGYRMEDVD